MHKIAWLLLLPVVLFSDLVLEGCNPDECTSGFSGCDGDVVLWCTVTERGHAVLSRTPCGPGNRCVMGELHANPNPGPNDIPWRPYARCGLDSGPDPSCENVAGFCKGNEPIACLDGHVIHVAPFACAEGYRCFTDPNDPTSWPGCVQTPPRDRCEDLGDAATVCTMPGDPCEDPASPTCAGAWHVSNACCDITVLEPEVYCRKPNRRLDGSIEERVGGFAGCKGHFGTDFSRCCPERGP